MAYYIGLDLGGTNIKCGVVDDAAQVLARQSVPTDAQHGPEAVIQSMVQAAQECASAAGLKMAQVTGVGIGSPGPIDFDAGVVLATPNMKGWKNVPLQARVAEALGRPAKLENDANAAAFGEFWAGAGRDPAIRHMIMLTLGTGVGSGMVLDGKLVHGAKGRAAEAGHMIIHPGGRPCGCGQRGCLETYAAASYTGRRAAEAIRAGASSSLLKQVFDRTGEVTAKDVFDAARAGDALAQRVAGETCASLGIACVNLCRILDPQMIVFAGGMIHAGDYLFDRVRQSFHAQSWHVTADHVRIVPALLGNDAGFIGAAAVARDAEQNASAQ